MLQKGQLNITFYPDDSKIFSAVKCARDFEAVQLILSNTDEWKRVTTSNLSPLHAKP